MKVIDFLMLMNVKDEWNRITIQNHSLDHDIYKWNFNEIPDFIKDLKIKSFYKSENNNYWIEVEDF